jgi:hypothetical protein
MNAPAPPFLFVHVPKTTGTSLRLAVEQVFPGRVAYDYSPRSHETSELVHTHVYGEKNLPALHALLVEEGKVLLGGHFHYRKYAEIFSPDHVLTFVREPLSRVVSEHQHACRHNGFEGTLLEFATTKRNRSLQASMLEGLSFDDTALIGISERYGDSLRLLQHRIGWRLPELVRNVNPTRKALSGSYTLTKEEEAELRSCNALDLELYAEAVRRFDEALAAAKLT